MREQIEIVRCDLCGRLCKDDDCDESNHIVMTAVDRKDIEFDCCDGCFGQILAVTNKITAKNGKPKIKFESLDDDEETDDGTSD